MKRRHYLVDDSIYPVFITTTITKWIPVFSDEALAVGALNLLERIRAEYNACFMGYVLMSNHFHVIMKTAAKGDLSIIIKLWKANCARLIIDYCQSTHRDWLDSFSAASIEFKRNPQMEYQIWQPRFDEFAIRTEDQFKVKLNYIHGNPMKHHLVENAEDYPYSSIHDYLGSKNQFINIELPKF
jgi:putative transposase